MVYWGCELDFLPYHPVQVPEQDDTWGGTYVCTHILYKKLFFLTSFPKNGNMVTKFLTFKPQVIRAG